MKVPYSLLTENFIEKYHITDQTECVVCDVDAKELLTPDRIDLAAKLAYIEARESGHGLSFAKELYDKHIEAFSMGYYTEPGNSEKNSLQKYYDVFDALIDDFKRNGFDETKSLIPVGKNNIILDGAHRTACGIYFGKQVKIIRFPELSVCFNYEYFRTRKLNDELLKQLTMVYARYTARPLYCACLWPASDLSGRMSAINMIADAYKIVLKADIQLSWQGLRNLMIQIYGNQAWIGTPMNHFSGVKGKADACFRPNVSTTVVVFEGRTLEDTLLLKDCIREIFKIGKHSIHMSDDREEALLMIQLLLNENSVYALNYGQADRYDTVFENMLLLNREQPGAALNHKATLSYFGIKKYSEFTESMVCDSFDCPRDYFTCLSLKLPTLPQVKKILEREVSLENRELLRNVTKLLRASGENRNSMTRKISYAKITAEWKVKKFVLRMKQAAARITTKAGVYDVLHRLHNALRK